MAVTFGGIFNVSGIFIIISEKFEESSEREAGSQPLLVAPPLLSTEMLYVNIVLENCLNLTFESANVAKS